MRLLILAAFFVSVVKCMKLEISIKPLQDDGEAVGESACESEFFKEECSKGDKIYKSYVHVILSYCENECRLDKECKSFFMHIYDCFLTKIPVTNPGPKSSIQTTSSLGIAGPLAKLLTVSAKPAGVYKSSVGKKVDCNEFHFEECDTTPDEEVLFKITSGEDGCKEQCNDANFDGGLKECNSFAHNYNESNFPGCFTSGLHVINFMEKKCKYKRGRIDLEATTAGNYDTICLEKNEINICRRGNCKIDFLEPFQGKTEYAKDESTCQEICAKGFDVDKMVNPPKIRPCTHYRWTVPANDGAEDVCQLYYPKDYNKNNTGTKSRKYDCGWYAAQSQFAQPRAEAALEKCKAGGAKHIEENGNDTDIDEILCTKKFRVIHATNGRPVEGATVTWHLDHLKETDQTGKTDWFGEFEVNLTAKNVEEFDFMKIVVSKEGFDDQEIAEVPIKGDWCEQSVLIALNPKSKDGRIILAWDKNVPTDIDLYLIEFAQKQIDCKISYEQMTADCSNNTLDIDNQKGGPNGPETITVKDLDKAKTYMVLAHKFSSENTGYFCGSGARVAVCVGNQGCKQHYSIPKKCFEKSSVWLVGCFKGTTGPGDMKVIDKLIANDDQTQYPEVSPLPSISECGY